MLAGPIHSITPSHMRNLMSAGRRRAPCGKAGHEPPRGRRALLRGRHLPHCVLSGRNLGRPAHRSLSHSPFAMASLARRRKAIRRRRPRPRPHSAGSARRQDRRFRACVAHDAWLFPLSEVSPAPPPPRVSRLRRAGEPACGGSRHRAGARAWGSRAPLIDGSSLAVLGGGREGGRVWVWGQGDKGGMPGTAAPGAAPPCVCYSLLCDVLTRAARASALAPRAAPAACWSTRRRGGGQGVATGALRVPTLFLNADTFEMLWPEEGNKLLYALTQRSRAKQVPRPRQAGPAPGGGAAEPSPAAAAGLGVCAGRERHQTPELQAALP